MTSKQKHRVVAIEEHYSDDELVSHYPDTFGPGVIRQRLRDISDQRLREMDEAGVDMQVLSHAGAGTQMMAPETAVDIAPRVNDRLREIIDLHPQRFAGLSVLPTPVPEAAAEELERSVKQLGFKGAMIHGLTNGEFIDKPKYWPIFERAEALDVPLYLHPSHPDPRVSEVYYADYVKTVPGILNATLGYTVEAMVQGVRMVLSGVFDRHPNLKIILGHLGEGIPFLLGRIDATLKNPANKQVNFREVFCRNFYITTSGFFSDPALFCSMLEIGVDRILFAIDWPWGNNRRAVDWLEHVSITAEDRAKIFGGNSDRLLRLTS